MLGEFIRDEIGKPMDPEKLAVTALKVLAAMQKEVGPKQFIDDVLRNSSDAKIPEKDARMLVLAVSMMNQRVPVS